MADARLASLCMSMFGAAPPVLRIRTSGEWGDTADQLRELVRSAGLGSIAPQVEALIETRTRDPAPLEALVRQGEAEVDLPVLIGASATALAAPRERKVAAFILSTLALLLFAGPFRRIVDGPRPHYYPWHRIPRACVTLAAASGAVWPARELVRYVHGVMDSYRPQARGEVGEVLEEWRQLGREVERRLEIAIANLADDLRESCRPGAGDFRAEVGAIAWTLGLVPESTVFRAPAPGGVLPSPRFFQLLVRHSLSCMGADALLQYVWLELKDRGPFSIREHESLFPVINSRYNGDLEMVAELTGVPLPRLYARNLIAWFRGRVDPGEAQECMHAWFGMARMGLPDEANPSRGIALAFLLAGAGGESWLSLTTQTMRQRGTEPRQNLHLRLLRSGVPQFYANERTADPAAVIGLLEQRHANALTYWLDIGSPRPTDEERARLDDLLDLEARQVELLRGTFFEMLLPALPEHYHYYGSDGMGAERADSRTAHHRYGARKAELRAIRERMRSVAPTYIARRADEDIGLRRLVQALGAHRA